jgi:hypothetical protein
MKKILITILLFLTAFASGQEPYTKPMLGRQVNKGHQLGDFVGAWFMLEGAGNKVYDISGNNHIGTFSAGAASPRWTSGLFGPAINFDGGDNIDCGTSIIAAGQVVMSGQWTALCWAKTDDNSQSLDMLDFGDLAGHVGLGITSATGDLKIVSGGETPNDGSDFNNDTWYQAVFMHDGTDLIAYLNGVFDYSVTPTGSNWQSATEFHIGSRLGLDAQWLGDIDHVIVWNRLLTASEIAQLYREPFCMFKEDLPVSMMYSYAAAPSGQVILIQMSAIPLILIPALVFMFRRKF